MQGVKWIALETEDSELDKSTFLLLSRRVFELLQEEGNCG